MTYYFDYDRLLFAFILTVIGVIYLILKRERIHSYKEGIVLMALGIGFLISSVIIGGLIAGHWDSTFIIAILSLKISNGGGWLSRGPATLGYTFIVFGVAILIIVKSKNIRKE